MDFLIGFCWVIWVFIVIIIGIYVFCEVISIIVSVIDIILHVTFIYLG